MITDKEFLDYLKEHNLMVLKQEEFLQKAKEGYLLDDALSLLVELHEDDPSYFCEEILSHPKEEDYCSKNCKNFSKECILRYLKMSSKVPEQEQ